MLYHATVNEAVLSGGISVNGVAKCLRMVRISQYVRDVDRTGKILELVWVGSLWALNLGWGRSRVENLQNFRVMDKN